MAGIAYRRKSGTSERRLILLFAGASALFSMAMNNLAAAALVLPSAMDASRRSGVKASKLLIPVAYGSLLGGAATYFTTANIIVSDLLTSANPPQQPLHILDFTLAGGLITISGLLFLWAFGPRLLPDRDSSAEVNEVRRTGSELAAHYQLAERLWELRVVPGSILAGGTLEASGIARKLGVAVAAIWRGDDAIFAPGWGVILHVGDLLLVVGREERVRQIAGVEVGPNSWGARSQRGDAGRDHDRAPGRFCRPDAARTGVSEELWFHRRRAFAPAAQLPDGRGDAKIA